jgi:hypothetical protein
VLLLTPCSGIHKPKTIMKASYFEQLTEAAQTDAIWEHGTFLARRQEGFYNILLFQIDNFYTEVYYHSHFNVIIQIVSFSDTGLLEPYFKGIHIPEFFGEG